jgi:hypothetical protein
MSFRPDLGILEFGSEGLDMIYRHDACSVSMPPGDFSGVRLSVHDTLVMQHGGRRQDQK